MKSLSFNEQNMYHLSCRSLYWFSQDGKIFYLTPLHTKAWKQHLKSSADLGLCRAFISRVTAKEMTAYEQEQVSVTRLLLHTLLFSFL